jgi:hypothetical protein
MTGDNKMAGRSKANQDRQQPNASAETEQPQRPIGAIPAQDAAMPAQDATVRPSQDPAPAATPEATTPEQPHQTQHGAHCKQRSRNKGGYLDRALQARIGGILRDSFTDIEREPLPERLQELVKALQAGEKPC